MKKFIAVLLGVLMLFSLAAMTACKKESGETLNEAGYYEGNLEIRIVKAGYGVQWLYDIVDAYEKEYPGATAHITETSDRDSIAARVRSSANDSDIVVSVDSMFNNQADGYFYDLSNVFDSVQDGYDKPLRERMNQSIRKYFETEDGKIYQMPWQTGYQGFLYNKTVLDDLFGEKGYTLPRTTTELNELCARVWSESNRQVYPVSMTTQESYLQNVFHGLWYQYSGERRDYYFQGYYPQQNEDGTVTYVASKTKEDLDKTFSDPGREKALEALYSLCVSVELGGYAHDESNYMTFQEAQKAFIGYGYGSNPKKCAFMVNGDWFYKEMEDECIEKNADIRFMKMPILSAVTETLETENVSEETLRSVVDAVDANEPWSASLGVSENDYRRISTLRYTALVTGDDHVIVVPRLNKNGTRFNLVEQFLKFLVSDEAQALFVMDQRGLNMPYGFNTDGFSFNTFTDSVKEVTGDNYNMITYNDKYPFIYAGGISDVGYAESMFFKKEETAKQLLDRFKTRNLNRADTFLKLVV